MIKFQDLKEIHNKASILNENSNCFDEIIDNEKIKEIVKGEGFSRTDVLDLLEKLHIEYTNTNSKKILTMYKCFKYIFNYFQHESNYTNDKDKIIISQGGASAGFVNFITSKFYANAHCYVVLPNLEIIENENSKCLDKSKESVLGFSLLKIMTQLEIIRYENNSCLITNP